MRIYSGMVNINILTRNRNVAICLNIHVTGWRKGDLVNDIKIEIEPLRSSIMENVSVKIKTNQPLKKYRIIASTRDDRNKLFRSSATFIADKFGMIDLTNQAPLKGEYDGMDPAAFMWSMKHPKKKEGIYVKHTPDPIKVNIQVYREGKLLQSKTFTRLFYLDDVQKETIEDDTIVGTVYYPKREGKFPFVVIVGGSEDSVHEPAAAMLASNGYFVLALAYYGRKGLPNGIINIPLEYVDQAIRLLEKRPMVNKDKIGIIGHSRGSELALLYALHFKKVKAVIAAAPSAVVHSGMIHGQFVMKPAWTVQGLPIPYFKVKQSFRETCSFFYHWILRKPYSSISAFPLKNKEQVAANAIPVQDIQAPLMFFAGLDDQVQPAAFYTKIMEEKLQTHPFKHKNKFIYYADAGHFSAFPSAIPNLPQRTGNTRFHMTTTFGGTKKVNAKTAQDSWEKTLEFLQENLKLG